MKIQIANVEVNIFIYSSCKGFKDQTCSSMVFLRFCTLEIIISNNFLMPNRDANSCHFDADKPHPIDYVISNCIHK